MATRGQLGSNAIEVTLCVHLVFLGKERRPTFGGSRAFLLDTPPHPGPPQRAQVARWDRGRPPTRLAREAGAKTREYKVLICSVRRGGRSFPGAQPNLASLLWPQKLPNPANSGRAPRSCGHGCPRPRPSAGRGGCQPRASLGESARGPGELRPNSPGLHGCPGACR